MTFRNRFAAVIGNLLEHYDNALFGLLAPFIAPLFFSSSDPLTALIYTYGMLPLGLITRPLGSLFFGWIGDRWGRKQALSISLLGMSLTTLSIGFLPTAEHIGFYAPLCLALARMGQSFFAAGEASGGAIFILEHTQQKERSLISSFYDASSIAGILIASISVTLLSYFGKMETEWRFLFLAGTFTALVGFVFRYKAEESEEFKASLRTDSSSWIRVCKEHRKALLLLILASGFSYTTYALPTTLMNGYIPLISSLSKREVSQANTFLLLVDMALLPCFGFLAKKWGKETVMLAGAGGAILCALPLFTLLKGASLYEVSLIRFSIILLGVSFAAPYHAWAIEQVPPQHRYLILSLGYALGSQCIGSPSPAICLWLYQATGWIGSPGLFLLFSALGALFALLWSQRRDKNFELS